LKSNKPKIAVIGANARALAKSAKSAGYETYLVDYFSDIDTLKSADHVFSMQKNPLEPNFREEYSREKLTDFAVEKLNGKVENVLLASSIGSDSGMIEKLKNYFKISGNNPGQVGRARNWEILMKIFNEFKINYPGTLIFDGFCALQNNMGNLKIPYPVVIKPSVEKEFQTGLIDNEFQLNNFLDDAKEKFKFKNKELRGKILIQEFIEGMPASASILSDGKCAIVLSINRQLIGIQKLNAPGRFTYCGYVIPAKLNNNLKSKISKITGKIISELGLVGSVGIDFVLKNNEFYFMEVNPRFQDTIDAVEKLASLSLRPRHASRGLASYDSSIAKFPRITRKHRNINLVEEHLKALDGKLNINLNINFANNNTNNTNNTEKYFAKGILFANKKIKTGNLNNIPNICDIPAEGTVIHEGEPVCTIFAEGKNEPLAMENLFKKVKLINYRQGN